MLPPLTDDLVDATEAGLGVTLPHELLVLLRRQNGGAVSDAYSRCPSAPNFYAEDHVPFDFLHGIGPPDLPDCITLLDTPYLVREWGLPTNIVLLSGDGHYWVVLDYRAVGPSGEPSVTWIDNEMEHELPLAPDFRAFVEMLTSNLDGPDANDDPRTSPVQHEPPTGTAGSGG